ncbi:Zn(2+)-responsive transcriptional regulator [Salinibacter altiplanensis]|uniref:Zn(2+)-responsive transcriptional regulator n=1 Tax=Salinibacter altiplanensis TaxID=1803181 RepID=UPI000C9FA523|nr:Zn(2+)-responsive transcriptional regulator [Salinibacter altiplanensis]
MDGMTRGEVAKKADVNPETLRYYERKELIPKPRRSDGGFRLYDEHYVGRLRFIQRAKELGFTLAEIKDLLDLQLDEEATCQDVKAEAEEKLKGVAEKIQDLKRIRSALTRLADTCEGGGGPTSDCPILDAMEEGEALGDVLS